MKKIRGIYLIPDPVTLKPDFGPSEHIRVGIRALQKYFEIETVVFGKYADSGPKVKRRQLNVINQWFLNSKAVGLFRDLKRLFLNHLCFLSYFVKIKKAKPEFIYERSAYLNYNGLLIAKLLNIHHFYEVNWIHSLGIKGFYASYFQPFSRIFEVKAYADSDHCFFVGNQNKFLNLRKENWSVVQNGVSEDVIRGHSNHVNRSNGKLQCCFVANLTPQHRFDLFTQALSMIKRPDRFIVHLIGYHFENVLDTLPSRIKRVHHGPVKRGRLPALLKEFNIGLIFGGHGYGSFMKLYEYAAAKLLVICPDLENLKNLFTSREILFFKTNDPTDLAEKMDFVTDHSERIAQYGQNLYERVKERFTWEMIFGEVKQQMDLVFEKKRQI